LGLSRSFYQEFKKDGIRTYFISPAGVQTKLGKENPTQNYNTLLNPKEVAQYIVYTIKYDSYLVTEELRLNRFV
jgi:short-subunit dehydrogenase